MKQKKGIKEQIANILPLLGIVSFIGLGIFSSTLYPGGSRIDLNSEGFDWINNYWCNLMSEKGINGQPNPSRPFSILAFVILCMSLMTYLIQFAEFYVKSKLWKRLIKVNLVLSITFAMLIFTQYHDLMIFMTWIFALFALFGLIKEVYKSLMPIHKIIALLCIILLGMNLYLFYMKQFMVVLPLLQKITFVIVLISVIGFNYELTKKKNKRATTKPKLP